MEKDVFPGRSVARVAGPRRWLKVLELSVKNDVAGTKR